MQITSDRDRVPGARCPRRRRVEKIAREESTTTSGAADGDEEDEMNRAGKRGRKGGSETERDGGRMYHGREKERVHVHAHVRMYTRRRETRPIVIAIPTGGMFLRCAVSCRPATKPERTHPTVRSRPSNGATGCTTFHLPSCLPPAIHAVPIHTPRTAVLFVRTVN